MRFGELVKLIFPYFQSKPPGQETKEVWVYECGNYPEQFYDWAYARLKSGKKTVLENFPLSVNQLWEEWCRKNPGKVDHSETACRQPACHNGIISYFERDENKFWQIYGARCGHCRVLANVNNDMLMTTVRKIEDDGNLPATWANIQRVAKENHDRSLELYPEKWARYGKSGRRKIFEGVSATDLEHQLFGGTH